MENNDTKKVKLQYGMTMSKFVSDLNDNSEQSILNKAAIPIKHSDDISNKNDSHIEFENGPKEGDSKPQILYFDPQSEWETN